MLWCDAGELDQLPRRAAVGEMPLAARQALAMARVAVMGDAARLDAARATLARRLSYDLRRGSWWDDGDDVVDAVSLLLDVLLFWWR
jgi:hypothetical protein